MWQPLQRQTPNPQLMDSFTAIHGREFMDETGVRVYDNDTYEVICRDFPNGLTHLSIKRKDRAPIRDWRHLQQMKNETCGPEREGLELYPAESRLVDGANEYHMFVLPEGTDVGLGFPTGLVSTDEQVDRFNDAPHKGHQEPWEEGLTTGRNSSTPFMTDDEEAQMEELSNPGPIE